MIEKVFIPPNNIINNLVIFVSTSLAQMVYFVKISSDLLVLAQPLRVVYRLQKIDFISIFRFAYSSPELF